MKKIFAWLLVLVMVVSICWRGSIGLWSVRLPLPRIAVTSTVV